MNEYLNKVGNFFLEALREGADRHYSEEMSIEREYGIFRAVESYLDLKISNQEIIKFLDKYWGVSKDEAIDMLDYVKTIIHPITELTLYLREELLFSHYEIGRFIELNRIEIELQRNRELSKLSPKALYERYNNLIE